MGTRAPATLHPPARPRGFSLVEILVVIAVVAVLVGVLLPALRGARDAARATVCLANLRQMALACRQYADDHKGRGPAIGQPYAEIPNWALVVQQYAGRDGSTPTDLYTRASVLVCPATAARSAAAMQRTYAMNATGHAGAPADPDTYDAPPAPGARPVAINFDAVPRPSASLLLVDSLADPLAAGPDVPPPTRTASVIDFRLPDHLSTRLGRPHPRASFNWAAFDGSARAAAAPDPAWAQPLP